MKVLKRRATEVVILNDGFYSLFLHDITATIGYILANFIVHDVGDLSNWGQQGVKMAETDCNEFPPTLQCIGPNWL